MVKKTLFWCGLPLIAFVLLVMVVGRAVLKAHPKSERSETVTRGDVEIKVVETGTVEPLHKVEVKSKVGGKVLHLLVEEGARVKQGQLLAVTDPQEVNAQVAQLQSQLAGAQARLASARKNAGYQQTQTSAGITQYQENVSQALAHLRSTEAESSVQPEMTRESINVAKANLDAAHASLNAQQQSLKLLIQSTHPQNLVSAQANYDQAVAQMENDQRNLERQKQLLAKGFVAQQAVDTAVLNRNVSEAHLRDVKQKFDLIKQANALEEANARAQLENARSQVRQMEASLAQAKATVINTTKQRDMESARAAYAQALAQLASARNGRTQDQMRLDDMASAQAEVQQIQNQLKERLVNQRDTMLFASMPGVVTKKYVEEGELITSGISSFSSGTPVYQIADLETMLVKININEVDIAKIHPGLLTEVTIDASKGVTFLGRVRKVSPSALADSSSSSSSSSSNSGSSQNVIRFAVEIQVDHADPRLKPGMSAHCTIVVARKKNVLRLPTNCVTGTGDTGTVQIVNAASKEGQAGGQAKETTTPRTVTVGLRGDDFVEILSGLNEGEKVRPAPYSGPPRKTVEINGGP